MNCESVEKHIGAFIDEELQPAMRIEFDAHFEACEGCRERLEFELVSRDFVRDALEVRAPEGLLERTRGALEAEDTGASALGWRMVPAAAAAAVLIFSGAAWNASRSATEQMALEDVVRLHENALPADVRVDEEASPERVNEFFRGRVPHPVHAPQFDGHAKLVGARLSNVRERQAAALYYDVDGRRVTVVVTDAPMAGEESEDLQVGQQRLRYQELRGHRVPVREEAGLNYAFTGDVDRETLLRLATSARIP